MQHVYDKKTYQSSKTTKNTHLQTPFHSLGSQTRSNRLVQHASDTSCTTAQDCVYCNQGNQVSLSRLYKILDVMNICNPCRFSLLSLPWHRHFQRYFTFEICPREPPLKEKNPITRINAPSDVSCDNIWKRILNCEYILDILWPGIIAETHTCVMGKFGESFKLTGTEWPGMGTGLPLASNLPIRGPNISAPINAATPPKVCTTPLPAKS